MTYQTVTTILQQYDADMGTAEAHGVAAGMLCVEPNALADNWLNELVSDQNQLLDDDKTLLLDLFERTRELLNPEAEDFTFDLFLPDDDEPLPDQVEALRCWCQGFLFGVGYAGSSSEWPGDTAEVMQDLIELTKLDSETAESEDDENDLIEIHEYVRGAVFIVRDQFALNSTSQVH